MLKRWPCRPQQDLHQLVPHHLVQLQEDLEMRVQPYQAAAAQHLARLRQQASEQHQQALVQHQHQHQVQQGSGVGSVGQHNSQHLQPVAKK